MKVLRIVDVAVPVTVLLCLLVLSPVVYRPQRGALMTAAQEVAQAEDKLNYIVDHTEEIERALEYLPQHDEGGSEGDERFLLQLNDKLRESGITPRSIQPKGTVTDGEYVLRTYQLELDCSYAGFADFIDGLYGLPELVLIEDLNLKSSTVSAHKTHRAVLRLTLVGH